MSAPERVTIGNATMICGDCRDVLQTRTKITAVLLDMLLPRKCLKITWSIVQAIAVSVMNDHSRRYSLTMSGLPDNNRTKTPRIRICNFDKSSRSTIFVFANADGANFHALFRFRAFFKLGIWRQMNSFDSLIPWLMLREKRISWRLSGSPFIPNLVIVRHFAICHVPLTAAGLAAKARSFFAVWLNLERAAAYFACFRDHYEIIPQFMAEGQPV